MAAIIDKFPSSENSVKDKFANATIHRLPTPPQDDELVLNTMNDVLLARCESNPEDPLVGYASSLHTAEDYVYYTARDLDRFANGAIQDLLSQGLQRVCHALAKLIERSVLLCSNARIAAFQNRKE